MGYATGCTSVCSIGWAEDQGSRPEMEDAYIIIDSFANLADNCYIGVYDGHGGTATVDFLSMHLHNNIRLYLESYNWPQAMTQIGRHPYVQSSLLLKKAFMFTDRQVIEAGIHESGATACVCLIRKEENQRVLYCAHLGDSRAVLCRSGRPCQRLTSRSDHKAYDPIETLSVEKYGGFVCNERVNARLAVSRAFGDAELKQTGPVVSNVPDVKCLLLSGDEKFIIVACDGLWDVMKDEHAVEFVLQFADEMRKDLPNLTCDEAAEILARALVEEALTSRESGDNITVVVVLLDPMGFIQTSPRPVRSHEAIPAYHKFG